MKKNYKPALAYHALTPLYDQINSKLGFGRVFIRKVLDVADIRAGDNVLDVGSGTGLLIQEVLQKYPGIEITGIDPDKKVLRIAENRLKAIKKEAQLVQGYAQKLPFPDNSFDIVVSTLAFHHMPDEVKHAAIKEIRRVLTKHGRFILADFGKPQTLLSKILLQIGSTFDGRENMKTNLAGGLPKLLEDEEFTVKDVTPRYKGIQFLVAKKTKT